MTTSLTPGSLPAFADRFTAVSTPARSRMVVLGHSLRLPLKTSQAVSWRPAGAEFFGLSHPAIQHLIQSCSGARKCAGYRWFRFEVCRPADGPPPEGLPSGNPGTDYEAFQNQGLAGPVGLDFPTTTPSPPSGNGYAELFLPCGASGGSPIPQSPESDTD
uniref:Uncharacterized protein n=1 Tax=Varanus komodoensis TaxID=61221 RepID=A0A8D2JGR5_VARKO